MPFNARKILVQVLRHAIFPILLLGKKHYCPVCRHSSSRFFRGGVNEGRPGVKCPYCSSLERHRLIALAIDRYFSNFVNSCSAACLHVAPEPVFEKQLARIFHGRYLTLDLAAPDCAVRGDLTRLPLKSDSVQAIACSHVLEHIPDDRAAVRECYRAMAPGGIALFAVPVTCDKTDEDPDCDNPAERRKRFGQEDHFRQYGPDVVERFREAGFEVQTLSPADVADEAGRARMVIPADSTTGSVHVCRKGKNRE